MGAYSKDGLFKGGLKIFQVAFPIPVEIFQVAFPIPVEIFQVDFPIPVEHFPGSCSNSS